jgi:signal transduction histidine kinase
VFERFHRGGAGRMGPPGSGLGLAIARELARRSGGDVTISPRSGGGTIAILSFSKSRLDVRGSADDGFARA